MLASDAAFTSARAVNSRGVSAGAVARQVAKMTGVAPDQSSQPRFPGCAAHIWDWFLTLVPYEGPRWLRSDVDLLRCQSLIAALSGDAVRGHELRLLGEVIGQYVRQFTPDQK